MPQAVSGNFDDFAVAPDNQRQAETPVFFDDLSDGEL
jgi:hypothetical protein